MRTGFYIIGKLLGYRNDAFTNRDTGEVKDKHILGVQLNEPDGFGGYNSTTQEVKVNDRVINEAFKNMVERFKGKSVMILVNPREWAMEGGRKGITYNFDENSSIEEVKS
ncbi:single-stranded DNA-binding protein [Rodentibacter genomosp. 2]|uniref:DNA-binding protein n=1 Tax=Rodentibacter genomosp. 2 TaxID=1908266 RepID=UPI0009868B8D|nr:single-stranded DNA-binding protein [Rodentibacter genomosp. 2]